MNWTNKDGSYDYIQKFRCLKNSKRIFKTPGYINRKFLIQEIWMGDGTQYSKDAKEQQLGS